MTTKIVLSAPLPRVYEETGNGRVAAMAAVAGQPSTLIGGDFKVEELTRISKETVRSPGPSVHRVKASGRMTPAQVLC